MGPTSRYSTVKMIDKELLQLTGGRADLTICCCRKEKKNAYYTLKFIEIASCVNTKLKNNTNERGTGAL